MYNLIDTHAHLDELEDLDASVARARNAGLVAIVAVGSNHESNVRVMEISQQYKSFVYPAFGLHPWEIGTLSKDKLEHTIRFIEDNAASVVAIGEVGLDYDKRVRKVTPKEQQQEVFRRLLEIAHQHDKPVSIHSRYAWNDALDIVKESKVKRAVFHWYTGKSSVLKGIIEAHFFISATPAIEYHSEHRQAIKETPQHNLLLETDCPVAYGRESRYVSEPADVMRTLRAVSELKGISEEYIAEQTTSNAMGLFDLTISASKCKGGTRG